MPNKNRNSPTSSEKSRKGKRARQAGVEAEREVVKLWEAHGIEAFRQRLSGAMEEYAEKRTWGDDVVVRIPVIGDMGLEVKLRTAPGDGGKMYRDWLDEHESDILFARVKGNKRWFAFMDAKILFEFVDAQMKQRRHLATLLGGENESSERRPA